jgi:hypothetical protein
VSTVIGEGDRADPDPLHYGEELGTCFVSRFGDSHTVLIQSLISVKRCTSSARKKHEW